MSAFSSPEDLAAYCQLSQGRDPSPSEYWGAACEYTEEKLKWPQLNLRKGMLKQHITPQDACDLLNELLKLDYNCANGLISYRQQCNQAVASHPTIQVHQYKDDNFTKVGIVGVLNGMFGIRDDGMGAICFEIDNGNILGFKPTPPLEEK